MKFRLTDRNCFKGLMTGAVVSKCWWSQSQFFD